MECKNGHKFEIGKIKNSLPGEENNPSWLVSLKYNKPQNIIHLFWQFADVLFGGLTKVYASEALNAKVSQDKNGAYTVVLGKGRVFKNLKDIEWLDRIKADIKCSNGEHVDVNPDGTKANFCQACGTKLNKNTFKMYRVTLKGGEYIDTPAVNKTHAERLITYGPKLKAESGTGKPVSMPVVHPSNVVKVELLESQPEFVPDSPKIDITVVDNGQEPMKLD